MLVPPVPRPAEKRLPYFRRNAVAAFLPCRLIAITATIILVLSPALRAEIVRKTEAWERTADGFQAFQTRIQEHRGRNLLARRSARLFAESRSDERRLRELVDGRAGQYAAEGRVMINGQPTVLSFYLGEAKSITEVGAFTCNGDTRANQDFEVRLSNNSQAPGTLPDFADSPVLTTGETILGTNGGGFHTWFVNADGGPLVPWKADWIQFRIWRTYSIQSGEPAHSRQTTGASAYIELEVLGTENDVVLPSREELAHRESVRKAPQEPEFVKRPTWQETVIASREAIYEWERMQDKLALFDSPIQLGSWHLLGPLSAKSDIVREIREAKRIDFAHEYSGEDGASIRWQKRDDLADWRLHDLTAGADKQDIFFLCRNAKFWYPIERGELVILASADQGTSTLLPEGQRFSVRSPLELPRSGWQVQVPSGDRQLLMELRQGKNGQRRFCFLPQPGTQGPGGGDANQRRARHEKLLREIRSEFPAAVDQAQIGWEEEDEIWIRKRSREAEIWLPGHADMYLRPRYRAAIGRRLDSLQQQLQARNGVCAEAIAGKRDRIAALIDETRHGLNTELSVSQLQAMCYRIAALRETISLAGRIHSMRLSVSDQLAMFESRYPNAQDHLKRIAALEAEVDSIWRDILSGEAKAVDGLVRVRERIDAEAQDILLANPLLKFDKLLLAEGSVQFASNWTGPNRVGDRIVVLSPVASDGQVTSIYDGPVSSMDVHWDGNRLLFSDGRLVKELNADGSGLRQVTPDDGLLRYDPCYLPDGNILVVSNACQQAVPCTGGANVGNLHLIRSDGTGERRITFDQDHNWNPTVMHDGRVLYSRWEYTDAPHYFSRLLFRMNPDGSGQMEYYGSNSYWPNATYWPRPIPGHPTMISCVVSGHHGVSRAGEFLLLDPARGRHEADGAVQKIPGYGQPVEPTMKDQLVTDAWPKFAAPYPLADPKTNLGAGKYFLACVQKNAWAKWQLCLVDIFDNMTPIVEGQFMSPIPLRPRPMPPVIPSRIQLAQRDATVYLADIYQGPGLKGFPHGTIKRLRIGTHHYRYFGNGDTRASSLEGGWDVKRILGTVPVNEDGSALFRVPANTPLFVQPLDADGKAQQVMRSWFTAMPGEFLSCVGCHERQNDVPPSVYSAAAIGQAPSAIEPWHGPVRGFSFDREVQPVLDRRCVRCHNEQPHDRGGEQIATIDLRAKRLHQLPPMAESSKRNTQTSDTDYSPAYLALQRYVRRPGYESDYHMPKPAEYEADTSSLVQLLKKGHYNVQLTQGEWERLYTWIDYNIPYPVNWRESHRPPTDEQVELRRNYKKLYARIDDRDEDPLPLPPIGRFEPPEPLSAPPQPLQLAGWPLTAEQAAHLQQSGGPVQKDIQLDDGITMRFVRIPAGRFVMGTTRGADDEFPQSMVTIDRPFYMGQFEVTNAQFACFDAQHDSGVINERWKDRSRRGTPINQPDAPVVRIPWHDAKAFCAWLSQTMGLRCSLPTEAQWEWACRAGTATALFVGDIRPGMRPFANIADESIRSWNHGRAESGYNDGVRYSGPGGRFPPNAWGVYDMHGNVAEWCRTTYRPYPYSADDGRDRPTTRGPKVVRGGSWNDTLHSATSASRWRYEPYKPVFNVGFRVVIETDAPDAVATVNQ